VIPGTDGKISSVEDVFQFGQKNGYPIIIKAVSGGGGKGMRIVNNEEEVKDAYDRTKSEAVNSFGNSALYVEKYIDHPKHIEVQTIVQVENKITEKVTDIDIVKTQILIADGENLFGDAIRMPAQEEISVNGYAIQSRITTEDPLNDFAPDTGKVIGYQSPGGP